MQFQPKTEKELNEAQLWPKGEYDFEVVEALPAVSGAGSKNPGTEFIKMKLRIFNQQGATRFVNTILHPAMDFALAHFCQACDLVAEYQDGSLEAADCVGKAGRCKIKITEAKGDYPAKNEVADYLVPKAEKKMTGGTSLKHTNPNDKVDDDDVAF
jgi:hypothetical protein